MDTIVDRLLRELAARLHQFRRLIAFWGPTSVVPTWMAPGVALGALLALVVVSGVAVASMGVLLTALLAAHLLLTDVFGVSVALGPQR